MNVSHNDQIKLSPHFTLGEMTKTSYHPIDGNIPPRTAVENLINLCENWLEEMIDTPSLSGYKIWLAQYAEQPSYSRTRYDMWQYTRRGSVNGISGKVDLNVSFMG